ncbi:hypothetical protein [Winogradskyella ursingii]|uniref:hypothetical protein n=1 Tax=Winogradskyella ursingii TaxID=2686079 RepID=UPI0015CB69AD|nr:hypothetical protein [Winogradskyella ursingii]
MLLNKILKAVLLFLAVCYIVLQGKGLEIEAAGVSAFMLVLLTALYCIVVVDKRKYFFMFLVLFAIAQVISFITWFIPKSATELSTYIYYLVNIFFIVSYLFLIINILRELSFKLMLSKFVVPIIVLFVLDVFCVVVVSSTTETVLSSYEYVLEFVYNMVVMVLLSAALINYMYRNDNKSMLYLMASICVVFSEIIQLAYYYILKENNLGLIYSSFLVLAFLLFYLQSRLKFTGPVTSYFDNQKIES